MFKSRSSVDLWSPFGYYFSVTRDVMEEVHAGPHRVYVSFWYVSACLSYEIPCAVVWKLFEINQRLHGAYLIGLSTPLQ